MISKFFFFLSFISFPLFALESSQEQLFEDLLIVNYINEKMNDRFPVTFNHFLQGGYINMPSAHMSCQGTFAFGYTWVPPYRVYSLLAQMTPFLEVTGNYRIFTDVEDPILTKFGFGDFSDKGVNFKIAFIRPEDTDYRLPGVAFGFDDILGTRNFKAKYLVATQVFLEEDLEISLGIGAQRIRRWFGGLCWIPWRRTPYPWLRPLKCVAEYDATPYKDHEIEKHPHGRKVKTHINLGLKYTLWDHIDLSASYIRGVEWAYAVSLNYNLGNTTGFLPKIDDPLPYAAPANTEPLGCLRPPETMAQELYFAYNSQGLEILSSTLTFNECLKKVLRIRIINWTYRREACLRERLNALIKELTPQDIDQVIVILDADGFPFEEYVYNMEYVRSNICESELNLLTYLEEYTPAPPCTETLLLKRERDLWNVEVFPRIQTYFGSSAGKFKYTLGIDVGINGFFPSNIYYSIALGKNIFSNIQGIKDFDRLNPSQLINVRSDLIKYNQQRGIILDEAYLQKTWNLGKGLYSRLATGYFEIEYGGVATEFLYYPVNSCWAIGLEGAILLKRNYKGLGFTNQIRKLDGFHPTFRYFIGSQFFLNFYHNWRDFDLDLKVSLGKFLANDYGARFEILKYFPSGLIIYVWTSYTNGEDTINGKHYHDMGVGFSMPLDIFYTHSTRDRWGYGLSAWLRDVGVTSFTGKTIYEAIREQRQ